MDVGPSFLHAGLPAGLVTIAILRAQVIDIGSLTFGRRSLERRGVEWGFEDGSGHLSQ